MSLFGSAKPRTPQYVTTAGGTPQAQVAQQSAEDLRAKQLKAGQVSTIKTSAQGVAAPAQTQQKQLLGQ